MLINSAITHWKQQADKPLNIPKPPPARSLKYVQITSKWNANTYWTKKVNTQKNILMLSISPR